MTIVLVVMLVDNPPSIEIIKSTTPTFSLNRKVLPSNNSSGLEFRNGIGTVPYRIDQCLFSIAWHSLSQLTRSLRLYFGFLKQCIDWLQSLQWFIPIRNLGSINCRVSFPFINIPISFSFPFLYPYITICDPHFLCNRFQMENGEKKSFFRYIAQKFRKSPKIPIYRIYFVVHF